MILYSSATNESVYRRRRAVAFRDLVEDGKGMLQKNICAGCFGLGPTGA